MKGKIMSVVMVLFLSCQQGKDTGYERQKILDSISMKQKSDSIRRLSEQVTNYRANEVVDSVSSAMSNYFDSTQTN